MTENVRAHRLTPAEKRYIQRAILLRAKLTNKAIAHRLGVSEKTVGNEAHRAAERLREAGTPVIDAKANSTTSSRWDPPPYGRPRALSAEDERLVIETIKATKRGRKSRVFSRLAREFGASVATLERVCREDRRRQLSRIADRFTCHIKSDSAGMVLK